MLRLRITHLAIPSCMPVTLPGVMLVTSQPAVLAAVQQALSQQTAVPVVLHAATSALLAPSLSLIRQVSTLSRGPLRQPADCLTAARLARGPCAPE